jgi:hypothetical protein
MIVRVDSRMVIRQAASLRNRGVTMNILRISLLLACPAICLALAHGAEATGFHPVQCEGAYPGHLQGVCANGRDAIYWSFTDVLLKTDRDGHIVERKSVASHHGDLCYHDGRIYVAVNLGKFNLPAGQEDSWVYVYDADTLKELERKPVPELVHGAGGMAFGDGRFIVVGGLPSGIDENYLYEYDESLTFRRRHVLASGYTLLGIQTAAYIDGAWWFGCYGSPRKLLKADHSFGLAGKWDFDASLGIVGLADGRILVARGTRDQDGHRGELKLAVPDDQHGLRIVD